MFKKFIIIIITILFLATFCLAENPTEPHFGLCGPGPSQNLALFQYWLDSGARINWWGPRWQDFIGSDGKLNFDSTGPGSRYNLDKEIDTIISHGGIVVLHLHTGAGWSKVIDDIGQFSRKQSSPPKDMKEYYDLIYQVVQHFKGKVKYYEIENEPYLAGTWLGTNQEYFQLLKTAYEAAHAAYPDVKITNGGIAMGCFVTYKLNELLEQGRIKEAQATYSRMGVDLYVPTQRQSSDVQQFVNTKPARRIIDFVDYLFKEGYKYIDVLEFHAYDDYTRIEEVLEYTKSKMKQYGWQDKPIRMKVGWNYRVGSRSENKNAQDVVKNLAIVFGGGVNKAIWFSIDDAEGNPHGLIAKPLEPRGGMPVPKPAYNTFKLMLEKLEGFSAVEKISLGKDVYAFKFIKANKPIYILWSEEDKEINLSLTQPTAKITDIYGQGRLLYVENNQLNLSVSTNPIFAEEI